jgi:hypothetical protein
MQHELPAAIILAGAIIAGAILVAPSVSPEGKRLERVRAICEEVIPVNAGGPNPRSYIVERCVSGTLIAN